MEMRGREGERVEQLGKKGGKENEENFARARAAPRREEGGIREREGRCLPPLSIPHRCLQMSPCRGRLGT